MLNNLSINIFEMNFYEDRNKWKQKLFPIGFSKQHEQDRVVDLLIYRKHYSLIKKPKVISGIQNKEIYEDDVRIHIQVKICY